MKSLILSALLMIPFAAMATNPELNGSDVVADQSANLVVVPLARTVIIKFDADGEPIAVAHSDREQVAVSDVANLQFEQVVADAELPSSLAEATPSNEMSQTQGTPQWGFTRHVRSHQGGVIVSRRHHAHIRRHHAYRYAAGAYYGRRAYAGGAYYGNRGYAGAYYASRGYPVANSYGWYPYDQGYDEVELAPEYSYGGQEYYPAGWQDGSTWGGESYSVGGPVYGYYQAGDRWNRGLY